MPHRPTPPIRTPVAMQAGGLLRQCDAATPCRARGPRACRCRIRRPRAADEQRELARRLVTLFIRVASLARPMSDHGSVLLSQDLAQYQVVVGELCSVEKLGSIEYKELRAFRTALFAETEQLHSALTAPPDPRGRAASDGTAAGRRGAARHLRGPG
eukprot:gene66-4230_t